MQYDLSGFESKGKLLAQTLAAGMQAVKQGFGDYLCG